MSNDTITPQWVNQRDAAKLASTSPQMLRKLEDRGFPKPAREGGFVRYSVKAIEQWMESKGATDGERI